MRKCKCLISRRFEPGSIYYETGALTSRPTKQLVSILQNTDYILDALDIIDIQDVVVNLCVNMLTDV